MIYYFVFKDDETIKIDKGHWIGWSKLTDAKPPAPCLAANFPLIIFRKSWPVFEPGSRNRRSDGRAKCQQT
jgi:hypothetical protein